MNNDKKNVLLLGGGGHARILLDLIQMSALYSAAGIVDPALYKGTKVQGVLVLGDDRELPMLYERGIRYACVAVGSTRDNRKRKELFERLKALGFHLPVLIHHRSIVSPSVLIADGVQIMAGSVIQAGAVIGENAIVNTGAIIEHDCQIGAHVHVCPGVILSGGSKIGSGAFIGTGSTIIQGIDIGENAVIAAGAVVIRNVAAGQEVMGVPAQPVEN